MKCFDHTLCDVTFKHEMNLISIIDLTINDYLTILIDSTRKYENVSDINFFESTQQNPN